MGYINLSHTNIKSGVGTPSMLLNENAHIEISHFAASANSALLIRWWTYLILMSYTRRQQQTQNCTLDPSTDMHIASFPDPPLERNRGSGNVTISWRVEGGSGYESNMRIVCIEKCCKDSLVPGPALPCSRSCVGEPGTRLLQEST